MKHSRSRLSFRLIVSVALAVSLLPTVVSAAEKPRDGLPAPAAQKQGAALDGILGELSDKARRSTSEARRFGLDRRMETDGKTVLVRIRPVGELSEARQAISDVGGRVRASSRQALLARVPISALEALAASDRISRITLPRRLIPVVTSEGVAEIGASDMHAAGLDGEGVKVGIVDVGFHDYTSKLGSELPTEVVTWSGSPSLGGWGTEDHGTAVAEIVHDVAPGAQLYLAQIEYEEDIAGAVEWMIGQGVKVINMSVVTPGGGPGDGSGALNEIIDSAVARGVFWANAVGNDRQNHWGGDYVDSNPADPNLNWCAFSGADDRQDFTVPAWSFAYAILTWKDSWTAAKQDYDLYLYEWSGISWEYVDASTEVQSGRAGDEPYESIITILPRAGTYAWAIDKSGATEADVDFDLFDLSNQQIQHPVADHSYAVPADNSSEGFVAVGAVGRTFAQEIYSAQGPTRTGRITPELCAPSDVTSSIYPAGFTGTSSSSPHVAGAAALLLQAQAGMSAADLEWYLESHARDLGDAGADNVYGAGLVVLQPADVVDWLPLPASPIEATLTTTPTVDYVVALKAGDDFELGVQQAADAATVTATLSSIRGGSVVAPTRSLRHTVAEDGLYVVRFARSAEDTRSSVFSATWRRTKSVRLALTATPGTTAYGGKSTIGVTFRDSDASPISGLVRFMYSYDNKNWSRLGSDVRTNAAGAASMGFTPWRRTYFKVAALERPGLTKQGASGVSTVQRYAYLTTPSSSSKVARNAAFGVGGLLRPRHAAGTAPVMLQCFRHEGDKWVLRKAFGARVSDYNSSTSRYAGMVALPYVGQWRIRAYTAGDSLHAATYSAYRYVNVQPTTISMSASRFSVTWGISSKLTGVLKDVKGRAIAGKYVYLESSANGSTWSRAATLRTSASGAVARNVLPRASTSYRFRFAGDSTQMPSTSAVKRIYIRQVVLEGAPGETRSVWLEKGPAKLVFGSDTPFVHNLWIGRPDGVLEQISAGVSGDDPATLYTIYRTLPVSGQYTFHVSPAGDNGWGVSIY